MMWERILYEQVFIMKIHFLYINLCLLFKVSPWIPAKSLYSFNSVLSKGSYLVYMHYLTLYWRKEVLGLRIEGFVYGLTLIVSKCVPCSIVSQHDEAHFVGYEVIPVYLIISN